MEALSKATCTAVIASLVEILRANYIFPDIAQQVRADLLARLDSSVYIGIDGKFFAYAVTKHMQAISKDQHLWLRYHTAPLPAHDGSLFQNAEKEAEWRAQAEADQYGIHKAEIMAGNIGYLDLRYFYKLAWGSQAAIVSAMQQLAGANAVIVDVRNCEGGHDEAVVLVSSYFFGSLPVHLGSIYWRDEDRTAESWTLAEVPGKRMPTTPLIILTSNFTFSAGEAFAYNLQALGRAAVVGEATGGGAHAGSPHRVHPHFEAFIPSGRAINPHTDSNWQGRGVQPDVLTAAGQALEQAHELAIQEKRA